MPSDSSTPSERRSEYAYAALMGLFIALVVLTNTVGVKLFDLWGMVLPVSIVWFPFTFLVTDIVSEVFGAARATFLVLFGFLMSLLLLAFIQVGIALPTSGVYGLGTEYEAVFAPVWRLLCASMAAYLLAQMVDLQLFHFFKRLTQGRHLWLRNNGSTGLSQLVDTCTVNTIFLYGNDEVFHGTVADLGGIILSSYLAKLVIALGDTPLCYLGVWWVRQYIAERDPEPALARG